MKTEYNVRITDNGNGTYSLGFVHRLKRKRAPVGGGSSEWVDGNVPKVVKLLTKGVLHELS